MSQTKLLKERKFFPLFWAQFLGAFNDNFLKNALVILIIFRAILIGTLLEGILLPLSNGPLLSLFRAYCKEILKGGESLITLFLTIFSIGTVIGSLLCERLSRKRLELRSDEIVCIFSEGALSKDRTMRAFKPGVERIPSETPVPVVPMVIQGMWESFFSREHDAFLKKPRRLGSRISLVVGKQVDPHTTSASDIFERVSALRGSA